MVYRYGWLSGAANLLFALFLLDRLLRGSVAGPPWQVVVGGAAVVGGALTWLLLALPRRIPLPALAVVHGAVFALVVVAVLGGLPTDGDAWIAATEQLSRAVALVRNGVEPVVPLPGLVAILAGLFWAVGALAVWGLRTGHPFVALLPPLALAAQFVTIDRAATSLVLVAVFVGLVAATILAVDADERGRGAGTMAALTTERTRRRLPGLGSVLVVGLSFFGALTASTVLADVVPRDGALEWRTATGLTGDFFGSVAYNPFVDIQKGLVSREGIPLFAARIEGEARPSEIYFRLLTLETYEDGRWFADRPKVYPLDERPWEDPAAAFAGPTAQVVADVEILGLAMDWLPAPYLPVAFEARSSTLEGNVLVRRFDGSLVFEGGRTATGDRYTVVAEIPRPDLAALAAEPDGDLSPLFATASAEHPVPEPAALPRREPPGRARLVDVPADLDPRIGAKARELTERLTTPFEKGLALEKWFRSSGGFVYDVEVTPGHDVESVGAWLFDATDNPDYRRGYCEQFATAMALMARTLDIPSRVVLGFTPGTPAGDGVVVVLDNNAHAWVELWMPTQGWVRFDPTPRSDGANPITYETVNAALGFDLTEYLDQVPEPIRPRIETPGAAPPVIARDDEP
ncbi:MAG TPA: transglutaminase domain-containing protein, partial [Actinobacteria bacterium]|nr:transglutaminase domain-containing protein [Actinomycetota bacterium]